MKRARRMLLNLVFLAIFENPQIVIHLTVPTYCGSNNGYEVTLLTRGSLRPLLQVRGR